MSIFNVHKVSKSFNNVVVLSNISFQTQNSGLISIVGKSGCGKSTLLNILLGIEKPSNGKVEFMSRDISKFKDKAFARYHAYDISAVFQHYNLLSNLTAFENVIMPLLIKGESKKSASKKVDKLFADFNLDYIKNQIIDCLSGGEKQRIAILRALITEPKVILCDEPTGALDSENSLFIMKMLKEISSSILVIVVSHNKELVDCFSDRIITLQNGKISSDLCKNQCKNTLIAKKQTQIKHGNWNGIFVKKYLKTNKRKNALSLVAISFGYLCLLLAVGFSNGSKISQEAAVMNNASVGYATISMKSYFEIENSPFQYEKSIRPTYEEIDNAFFNIDYLSFDTCLDYIFPQYPCISFNDKIIDSFQMIPLMNSEIKGNEIFINDKMKNLLEINELNNDEIVVSNTQSFSVPSGDIDEPIIKDEINFSMPFVIRKIREEFSFLNTPKVYYSYEYVKDFFKSIQLENISRFKHQNINVVDFIETSNNDDISSSFCLNVFLNNKECQNDFFLLIASNNNNEGNLKIDSQAYEIKKSYSDFISSFSNALFIFTIIAFVGVNLVIAILALSLFIEHKKESAILTCLGARNSSIITIYLKHNFLIVGIAFLLSILVSIPIQFLINNILAKSFGLSNLISIPFYSFLGIKFLLPIALFGIGILLSSIFVLLPIFVYRRIPLTSELRDE